MLICFADVSCIQATAPQLRTIPPYQLLALFLPYTPPPVPPAICARCFAACFTHAGHRTAVAIHAPCQLRALGVGCSHARAAAA
eukprot:1153054-Pelagomonas_calceolata.AAC.1